MADALARGESVADASFKHVSRSTGYKYKRALRLNGHVMAKKPGGGRPLKHSQLAAASIFVVKKAMPEASAEETIGIVFRVSGERMGKSTLSRELSRIDFTRKTISRGSNRRVESQRVSFWTQGPMDGQYPMCFQCSGHNNKSDASQICPSRCDPRLPGSSWHSSSRWCAGRPDLCTCGHRRISFQQWSGAAHFRPLAEW